MKRILYFKTHYGTMLVLWGLFFTATSFSFGPAGNVALADNSPQKKVQRVKVMINKDGKTTSIDTTFNLADDKAVQVKVDSILKKVQIVGSGDGKAVVHMHNGKMEFAGDIDPNGMVPPPSPPPVPPLPNNSHSYFQFGADPFSFDTKDASIISYEKKDIGKGLEKITIIRKKRTENDSSKEVEVKVEVSDDQKK